MLENAVRVALLTRGLWVRVLLDPLEVEGGDDGCVVWGAPTKRRRDVAELNMVDSPAKYSGSGREGREIDRGVDNEFHHTPA
jgi:hypothetical protein